MDKKNDQQFEELENKFRQKHSERQKKEIKKSGKSVFELQKIIKDKNDNQKQIVKS